MAKSEPGLDLGRVADLPDPGSRAFDAGGLEGFLVRRGARVRAYRDACPHTGAPLAWTPDGYLDADGELIQCSLHGALFLPDTGECVHGPCVGAFLQALPVRIVGGRIQVALPGAGNDTT
jgi:nitrite reductase/ring-hydroxylating ferredoxin subunit